ncbi:MAG: hypothetical protein RH949_20580 [Coleofasciculus sp. A1-SPW-01]|uniref:hypothetical protein n=1 Tax=Coleofasciculus sp. A1-SPW-01 TaxID=3070819 RepID=UPI0032F8B693
MKPMQKNGWTTRFKGITAFSLISVVIGGSQFIFPHRSIATDNSAIPVPVKELADDINTSDRLPDQVADVLLEKVSKATGLSPEALTIVTFKPWQWAYGCYFPTYPHACDQIIISGWKVTVGSETNHWVFLTDEWGQLVKLDDYRTPASLPASVTDPVLRKASEMTRLSTSELEIVMFKYAEWAYDDETSSLSSLENPVTIPGWEITVSDGTNRWVYITDEYGFLVQLFDPKNFIPLPPLPEQGVKPVPISKRELPPPLPPNQDIVFREIRQGGIAGETREIVLYGDGRVMIDPQEDMNNEVDAFVLPPMVLQFQRLIELEEFAQFKNLSYPSTTGGADFITYTVTSRDGTVKFNDLSYESLPSDLRTVVDAWKQILSSLRKP